MIVVKVELHNANTGEISELGRMIVANNGGARSSVLGDYDVKLGRKGVVENKKVYYEPLREGKVLDHRRLALPIWTLVARALASVGFYSRKKDEHAVPQDHF